MKQTAERKPHDKLTVLLDKQLRQDLEQHRERLRQQTGLPVSMSAAAASLLRRSLAS